MCRTCATEARRHRRVLRPKRTSLAQIAASAGVKRRFVFEFSNDDDDPLRSQVLDPPADENFGGHVNETWRPRGARLRAADRHAIGFDQPG